MDVFDDLLLDALYRQDPSLGNYTLGRIGSNLNGGRLLATYPCVFALVKDIHDKRLESELAHPLVRNTGKPTGRIKFAYLGKAKALLRAAVVELMAKS